MDGTAGEMGESGDLEDFYAKKEAVPKFWREKYDNEAHRFWDKFYQHNTTHFFKDRHWLTREFPELLAPGSLLEVGCGVGNTIFPLLQENSALYVFGIDFSQKAVSLANEAYKETRCQAFVCDISRNPLPEAIPPVDLVSMIFVLSALTPERVPTALGAVFKALRHGGLLLLRDYAVNDGAHKKMTNKKAQAERKLAENFYVRGDGTQVLYFDKDTLKQQLTAVGFEVISIEYVEKETVNHKEEVKLDRTFVQAKCKRPSTSAEAPAAASPPPPAAPQT